MKNFYPEKPTVPFQKSMIEMALIIDAIKKAPFPVEVKRAAYVVIRNESSNGRSVINGNNLCGAQADSGRWPRAWDAKIAAVTYKRENTTNKERIFLVFDSLASGIAFVCDRVQAKGIFIGENVNGRYYKGDVRTVEQLADAYGDEWVHGRDATPTPTEVRNFKSMYNQAKVLFPDENQAESGNSTAQKSGTNTVK
jgi:hypothetical protein